MIYVNKRYNSVVQIVLNFIILIVEREKSDNTFTKISLYSHVIFLNRTKVIIFGS